MSDVPKPRDTEISNLLPVPYVTQYTDRTPTLGPLLLTVLKAWAVLMIEWGSLRFIDHAPVSVWIASSAVALLVLGVIEKRDWLNFKNRRYFPVSLMTLMSIWVGIIGYAYYFDNLPSNPGSSSVASALHSQLEATQKERDAARQERDAALRTLQPPLQPQSGTPAPAPPAPSGPVAVDDPNEYPPLTRERQRALVNELVQAKDVLGTVPVHRAAAQNEAFNYRIGLLQLFDRAGVPVEAGDAPSGGPDQTGVMVAIADLNNPSPAAKKILEILTITGMRPKVIPNKRTGDYYVFIGPRPL
jgi:hypothetical protein